MEDIDIEQIGICEIPEGVGVICVYCKGNQHRCWIGKDEDTMKEQWLSDVLDIVYDKDGKRYICIRYDGIEVGSEYVDFARGKGEKYEFDVGRLYGSMILKKRYLGLIQGGKQRSG